VGRGARAYRANTTGGERGQRQMRTHTRSAASEHHTCIGVQWPCRPSTRRLGWLAALSGGLPTSQGFRPATRREGGGREDGAVADRHPPPFLPPPFPSLPFPSASRPSFLPCAAVPSVPPRNRYRPEFGGARRGGGSGGRREGVCVCMCEYTYAQVFCHGRNAAPRGEGQIAGASAAVGFGACGSDLGAPQSLRRGLAQRTDNTGKRDRRRVVVPTGFCTACPPVSSHPLRFDSSEGHPPFRIRSNCH
jgi:hypothetical protein